MKTIIFDLGNVLVNVDFERLHKRLGFNELSFDEFMKSFEEEAVLYNRGDLNPEQFHKRFSGIFNFKIDYHEFYDKWSDIFSINETLYSFASSLDKEKVRVIIASNTDPVHYSYIKSKFGLGFIDEEFLSYNERCVKPDPEYFEKLLGTFNPDLDKTIFIDDNHANIKSAENLGLKVIWNNDNKRSLELLKEFIKQ